MGLNKPNFVLALLLSGTQDGYTVLKFENEQKVKHAANTDHIKIVDSSFKYASTFKLILEQR